MITIHLATASERSRADALVRRVYSVQGFGDHGLPGQGDTFIACQGKHMIGTLSLVVDEAEGLPADSTFKDQLNRIRGSGAKLCELTRFVLETQSPSAKIFHDLFGAIYRHGVGNYGCTDLIIQADPRHCCFYRRRLGFKPVGEPVSNPVYDTLAQLMRIHVNELGRHFEPAHDHHHHAHHGPERRVLRAG